MRKESIAVVASLLVLVLVPGCAKHVVFTKQIEGHATVVGGVTDGAARLYADMHGDLYPDPALAVDERLIRKTGTLRGAMWRAIPDACDSDGLPLPELALCQAAERRSVADWEAAQQVLWARAGNRIAGATGEGDRPVLLLIHGFNVPDADKIFEKARARILPVFPGPQPLVVQLHWDGFSNVLRSAWARAQFSGPLVGQRLRAALNELPRTTPLRILTHSSGAFVAASAFGDATAALPRAEESATSRYTDQPYARYVRNAASRDPGNPLRIPEFTDLRIGMIVAATPTNTFVGSTRYPEAGFHGAPAVLIFGVNTNDQTIAKGFNLQRWSYLGATTLGGDFDAAFDVEFQLERRSAGAVEVHVLDVSDAPGESHSGYLGLGQSHDWAKYLQRARMEGFLEQWLGVQDTESTHVDAGR